MDNKIEHFFVLKPDGKIGWIEKMPEYPKSVYRGEQSNKFKEYEQALQSAIDNAVEVNNSEDVKNWISNDIGTQPFQFVELTVGTVYSLQCSVEIQNKTIGSWTYEVALVTFSQPEREETQEELWDDAIAITGVYYPSTFGRFKVIEELSKTFTITRKTP